MRAKGHATKMRARSSMAAAAAAAAPPVAPGVLVTGCSGYVGQRLVAALRAAGRPVWGLDVRPPPAAVMEMLEGWQRVDLATATCADAVLCVMDRNPIGCVIHLASYGMSGKEQIAAPAKIRAVNEGGTRAVLEACRECDASLVYISTVNVCFAGREIFGEDDVTDCYAPLDSHVDEYSRSKSRAEQMVLGCKDVPSIALRLYGVYGEGEERHFPRMIRYFKWGLFARFGSPSDRSDWVHADNVVHACLLAERRLRERDPACLHQAFFIGDNEPVNTIDLAEPLANMVGVPYTRWWIPYRVMYAVGWLVEWLCAMLFALLGLELEPLLTRAEVDKVARTHYWRTGRAALMLGYAPVVSRREGLKRMYDHFAVQLMREGCYAGARSWQRKLLVFALAAAFLYAIQTVVLRLQ